MAHTGKTVLLNPYLAGMTRADLHEVCLKASAKPVHAATLMAYTHRHLVRDVKQIPDIPKSLRIHLESLPGCERIVLADEQCSRDGTRKLLLRLANDDLVETVLIPSSGRLTLCISTQIGCALGCRFCLTASDGLKRNLRASEMIAQIRIAQGRADKRIRNLVLMGMGEPLHNFREVARLIRIVTDPLGMAFSPKRVTVSTSGLVPGIYRMIEEALPCNLAISLHASRDEIRNKIMPVNRRYPISTLMRAARDFCSHTGKRILIEYVLLAEVNDSREDAYRLAGLIQGLPCTINLLPFNESRGSPYRRPGQARVSAFRSVLSDAGYVTVVRESRGKDILAACGQLRTKTIEKSRRSETGILAA